MTKREIAALACKILALYIWVTAIRVFGAGLTSLGFSIYQGRWQPELGILDFVLPLAFYGGIGLIPWLQAERLASYMVPGTAVQAPEAQEAKVIQTDIEPIAFSVVGLFILAGAIASAVGLLVRILYEVRTGWQSFEIYSGQTYQDAAMTAARLVIGLWLLLGSGGFARFLDRVRDLGKADVDDSIDESQD